MSTVPLWSLETIYPSVSSASFLSDIERVRNLAGTLEASPSLETYDELTSVFVNLDAYVSALISTDTSNEEYLKALSLVEDAGILYQRASDSFIRAVGRTEEKGDDGIFIREAHVRSRHLMSEEEEALAAELARTGENAWSRLQEALASSIGDGGATLTALRSLAFSPDREVRRNAFEREVSLLKSHENSFAAALSGVKGTVLTLERRRGWKSPVERSLFSSRISEKTLSVLLGVIKESLPVFREYLAAKAEALGISDFSFYDLFAPVGNGGHYSFEEAEKTVLSAYHSFSPEMAEFAEKAFRENWIDARMHPGKAGGAYDTYFPLAGESRVFCNFDSSYDSVLTLAHELGHAYHDSVLRSLPPSSASYPMTLAETASTFGELLVTGYMLARCGDRKERLFLTDQFLSSACQTIVDIYSRYLFEYRYFERRKEGDVSASECVSLMLEAEKEAYGDAVKVRHPYMWAVKSHYYDAAFSFYNYPYAFGLLLSLSLYSIKDRPGFASDYRDLLFRTGSMDAVSLLASIGLDAEDREFWKGGVDMIREFKEMMAQCV